MVSMIIIIKKKKKKSLITFKLPETKKRMFEEPSLKWETKLYIYIYKTLFYIILHNFILFK